MQLEEQGFELPKYDELSMLKNDAMAGSGLAARRLASWYAKLPDSQNTYEYWTHIAAENGSAIGQYNAALIYISKEGGQHSQVRARFWLEKAASQGDVKAQEELAALDTAERGGGN